ncbi:MAG: hypothetical protein ACK5O3_17455 [Burkholderiales bacterium]
MRWLRPDFQDPARLAQAQAQAMAETTQATQAELISPTAAMADDASDAGDSPATRPTLAQAARTAILGPTACRFKCAPWPSCWPAYPAP